MKSAKKPSCLAPVLTPGQIALHGEIAANADTLNVITAHAMYPNGPPPAEVMLAMKDTSIPRRVADENASENDAELPPIADKQYAVIEIAAPRQRGGAISSVLDMTDTQSKLVTPAGGSAASDLGFPKEEAERLLAEADKKIGAQNASEA